MLRCICQVINNLIQNGMWRIIIGYFAGISACCCNGFQSQDGYFIPKYQPCFKGIQSPQETSFSPEFIFCIWIKSFSKPDYPKYVITTIYTHTKAQFPLIIRT